MVPMGCKPADGIDVQVCRPSAVGRQVVPTSQCSAPYDMLSSLLTGPAVTGCSLPTLL